MPSAAFAMLFAEPLRFRQDIFAIFSLILPLLSLLIIFDYYASDVSPLR